MSARHRLRSWRADRTCALVNVVPRQLLILVALGGIAWFQPAASWADIVELKTGQVVSGECREPTSEGVVFEVQDHAIMTFRLETVRGVYCRAPLASSVDPGPQMPSDEIFKQDDASPVDPGFQMLPEEIFEQDDD